MVRSFACGDRCKSVKVVHVSCDTAVTQWAVRFALQQIGKPFDADFDITDTTKYYCTELVWQAYRHQHVDLSHGRCHHIQLLGMKKTCILPADLLPWELTVHQSILYKKPLPFLPEKLVYGVFDLQEAYLFLYNGLQNMGNPGIKRYCFYMFLFAYLQKLCRIL